MAIVKPLKLHTFYGIFMALYYVLISMSTFTFKVFWEIPCGEVFYFAETIQLIRGANQMAGFCMVWVFTYKLSCFVILRKCSCTTDLLFPYLDAGQYRSVEGEIGCFINRIASNFFFCSYDARIFKKNFLPVLNFLLIVLFCILL